MITVVIPSYNRRAATQRAIESVRAQTWRDLEIVVVDDHSRSGEIYQPAPDETLPIRVLRQPANGGVSAARNAGVAAAQGELIAFLDSDDAWLPHRLEQAAALLLAQPDPDNVLVYAAYYTDDGAAAYLTSPVPLLPGRHAMGDYLFLDSGCLHIDTWLATKKMLQRFPLDPGLSVSEDWDALLRMETAGVRFVHAPEPAAVRRVDPRPDRLTTHAPPEMHRRFLAQNAERLGPRARLIFESILREAEQPPRSVAASLFFKLRSIAASPLLGPVEKVALAVRYITARLAHKRQMRRSRRPSFGD